MKKYFACFAFIGLVMFGLVGVPAVTLAGDPVPGIDISLEEIPGGIIKNIQTDASGNYVFDKLAPGDYVMRLGSISLQKAAENHNTTRSNKTMQIALPGGGTEQTVNFAVSLNVLPGKDPGTTITVGQPGPGRIMGSVTMENIISQQITTPIKAADLGVENPGTLPTSGFYFLKEWRRGIQRAFTFNAVKKAELELNILNEKAAEALKVQETNPDNAEAINKAITNYEKNQERLMARIEGLKETSQNPNVDALLTKLVVRSVKHEQLFDEITQKEQAVGTASAGETVNGKPWKRMMTLTIMAASQKDEPEKFASRLEKALDESKGGELKDARSVEFIDELKKTAPEALKPSLDKARENLSAKLAENVGKLLEKESPGALDDLAQASVDYNSSRSNVKLIIKDAGVPDDKIEEILSKAVKEQSEADVAKRTASPGHKTVGELTISVTLRIKLGPLVAFKTIAKDGVETELASVAIKEEGVKKILDAFDDYVEAAENHNTTRSNKTTQMIKAGVPSGEIEKILSHLEAQARKHVGGVKYENIIKILDEAGVKEERINNILSVLDDYAQLAENHNTTRSNKTNQMINLGVPGDVVDNILTEVDVAVKEEGVKGPNAVNVKLAKIKDDVRKTLKELKIKEEGIKNILSVLDDYAQLAENHNTTRSNKTMQIINAGVSGDVVDNILTEVEETIRIKPVRLELPAVSPLETKIEIKKPTPSAEPAIKTVPAVKPEIKTTVPKKVEPVTKPASAAPKIETPTKPAPVAPQPVAEPKAVEPAPTAEPIKQAPSTFNLTVYHAGMTTGEGIISSSPAGINCGSDCSESYASGASVTLFVSAASGSIFTGWSDACSGSGSCVVTMDSDKLVTANFTLVSHSLTVSKSGTGSGIVTSSIVGINCGTDCSESYLHGTSITLSTSPASGSAFAGWSGDADCSDGAVSMNADKTCTAAFNTLQPATLTVSKTGTGGGIVDSSPAGINCGMDCSKSYPDGTSVTLTASPSIGSSFTGWSGACSGTMASCAIILNADKLVTANFNLVRPTLTVTKSGTGSGTVTSSPAGINCGSDCSESYSGTTAVFLTAEPNSGSVFLNWGGDADCSDGAILMAVDKTCTATFNLSP